MTSQEGRATAGIGSNWNILSTNRELETQSVKLQQTHLRSLTVSHTGIMLIR